LQNAQASIRKDEMKEKTMKELTRRRRGSCFKENGIERKE
jgi:hypothetical protein